MKQLILVFLILGGVTSGCAKASFGSGPESSKIEEPAITTGCRTEQVSVLKPTKVIFLVDVSGSNLTGPRGDSDQGTDPEKKFRFGVINEFFQKHGGKPSISWSFITFSGTKAKALIKSNDDQQPQFGNQDIMRTTLLKFNDVKDDGATPYKAALRMAGRLIRDDLQSLNATDALMTQYRIAILTDGYPTDYCSGGASANCPGKIEDHRLMKDVQSLVNLSPDAIQLSSVYYGLPDAEAAARLKGMAKAGNGQSVDTNVNQKIQLDDVIQVPTEVCM